MSRYSLRRYNFRTVEDFLEYLPDDERIIVESLRSIILDTVPDIREKLTYNVPYYYRYSRICFIWPSSVPWVNVPQYGVQLGFCRGDLLGNEYGFLEKGRRKRVYIKTFAQPDELNTDLVRAYLFEAVVIDEQLKKGLIC